MSDNIDIPIVTTGVEGIDAGIAALDRMAESVQGLGNASPALDRLNESMAAMQGGMTSSLAALTQSISDMKQVIATGFADISATNQKLIEAMGNSQAQAIKASGDKAVEATDETNMKLVMAAERQRDRQLAADNALNLAREGMLAGAKEKEISLQVAFDRTQAAMAQKAYADKVLDFAREEELGTRWEAMLAKQAATKLAMDAAMRAKSAPNIDSRTLLGLPSRDEMKTAGAQIAAQVREGILIEKSAASVDPRTLLGLPAEAEMRALSSQLAIQMRSTLEQEMLRAKSASSVDARTLLGLPSEAEARTAGAAIAAQFREGVAAEKAATAVDPRTLLGLPPESEMKGFSTQLAIQMRTAVEEAALQARAEMLTNPVPSIDPRTLLGRPSEAEMKGFSTQLAIQMRTAVEEAAIAARAALQSNPVPSVDPRMLLGLPPESEMKGFSTQLAIQMRTAVEAERAELAALRTVSEETGSSQINLSGALRQAESAFKGAAHEAGVYGLAHGQLIALLTGGAVAAALHHIAETGAEVEFQLSSFPALAGKMNSQPVDMDRFIGITAGTMTGLKEAAEGMHALAQAGQTQQQAMAALPDVMRLAQLGEMSVAQAAEMAVESMHAFGKSITDIGQIGDILVAVGSKSNVSVHTLAEDMKSAAVTGQMFNASMQEITATVGVLAERGLTIQPLSSALMKLYEPSDKVAKAMKELGLSTKDSEGNLKDYTVFMGELAQAVNQFKVPADIFKQLGMSSRDSKAIQVMTQDLAGYRHLLEEAENAQGKMFDATLVKADTAEGAWKRLGSTVDGSVTKAFEAASPAVQALEESLIKIAGSDGTVKLLTQLATAAANLTTALVDNAGALGLLVAGYAGMKVVSSVLAWTVELEAAEKVRIATATKAAEANAAEGTSLILLANGERAAATGAVALSEGAAVAATGLEAAAMGAKAFTAALGWIGVVLVTATTAYELFTKQQSASDEQFQKAINTAETSVDMYDKEIQRLKDLEEQLLKTGKAGVDAANEVATANLEFELGKAKADVVRLGANAQGGHVAVSALTPGYMAPSDHALEDAQNRVKALEGEIAKRDQKATQMDALRDRTSSESSINDLRGKIDSFDSIIFPSSKTKAAQQAADSANELLQSLRSTVIAENNYEEVKGKELELEKLIAATKKDAPAKLVVDKDAARAAIEDLREELRLKKLLMDADTANAKSENKRGELGDLQLITRETANKVSVDKEALVVAEKELAIARESGKQAQIHKAINGEKTARQKIEIDTDASERAKLDLLDKMDGLELQARAKVLASKGQLEDAYNLTYQAKNANMLANLQLDIDAAENAGYKARLVRYQQYLDEQRRIGLNNERFKHAENDFGNAESSLKDQLDAIKLRSGPGTGLASQMRNLGDQHDVYASMLPQLQAAQARVAATSSPMLNGGVIDQNKLKAAQNELKVIQDQMAAMRNTAVTMADTIAKALTDAFGKGGTAIGGMIQAATAYDVKMQEIQATLDQSKGTQADQQAAAEATSSAQIKAYGDMASSAKGFFDQNSNGYKIMAGAEKAFRAIELAQAIASAAKKISLKTAEVTTTVAGDATKVASGTAATAADVANAGVSGTAWGITAVARAIASMPFPLNLVAGAATMAAIVGLGIKLTGGMSGGSQTSAQMQAANGTGTIAGDPTAKSDSIAKSLSSIEKNTYDGLTVSQGMLSSLQAIETNIGNFAGLLMQSAGLSTSGTNISLSSGIGKTGWAKADMVATGAEIGALVGAPFIGAAIGYIASKVPALQHAYTSVFGGKQTLDANGFMMGPTTLAQVASQGVNAQTYADITTSGGWFRSDKHNTQTTSVGTEADRQIAQIITGIGDTIKTAAGLLGVSGDAFDAKLNSFVIDIGKIDLKGMSSADQQTALNNAFSKLSDQMTTAAFSTITQFSKAGEGALQTLTRVATDYQTVDAVFKSFGTTFAQVGMDSITAREHLIDLAGGLDKFTSQAEFFLKNIMPAGQQTTALRTAIDPTLAKYGLSTIGPDAVQQFANLTIALGSMGSAGAAAYTELMQIAPAFKTVTDVAKGLQDQIDQLTLSQQQQDAVKRAALDPANQILFDQLTQAKAIAQARSDLTSAYQNESQGIQSTIDKLKSFSLSLHSFVNSLQLGNLSPLNPADKYAAALAQFNDTAAKAKSGDATAQGNLQSVSQAFLQASQAANASNSTYQADYQRVLSVSDQMASWADSQVSTDQASLNALHDQVARLTSIDMGVMSVNDAINNLALAMSGGKSSSVNDTTIDALYKELLGRSPDAAGKAYWENLLQQGTSLTTIIDDIKHSTEYANYTNAQQPSTTVTPSTGYGTATLPAVPSTTAAAPAPSISDQITQLYWSVLGRAPDTAGLAYYVNAANNGGSLSGIADSLKGSGEYTSAHPAPDVSTAGSTTDPYIALAQSNAQMVAQQAITNAQLAALRTEQQKQADQQVDATMNAGADTADQVAGAITDSAQAAAWNAANKVSLR